MPLLLLLLLLLLLTSQSTALSCCHELQQAGTPYYQRYKHPKRLHACKDVGPAGASDLRCCSSTSQPRRRTSSEAPPNNPQYSSQLVESLDGGTGGASEKAPTAEHV
jgi:hypothetical protein